MQKGTVLSYFGAATTPKGFISYFSQLYDAQKSKVYILKGGPGTGKSTLMKKLCQKLDKINEPYELFYCSSDPKSLDGVRIPKTSTLILDGTAPHTLDPVFPGVCESIINLGECFITDKLIKNKEKIITLTTENKRIHSQVRRYVGAVGGLLEDSLSVGLVCCNLIKANNFAEDFAKHYAPKNNRQDAKEHHAFLSAVTPNGIISFEKTINSLSKDIYVIDDKSGAVSGIILSRLKSELLDMGYQIISFMSPVLPSKTDHIVIPELNLAVCTRTAYFKEISSNHRVIHSSRFRNENAPSEFKERTAFNKKASEKLLKNAFELLKKANAVHLELESFYTSSMDFDKLNVISESLVDNIINEI